MFILDEEKLSQFLGQIADGFVRSPLEIALFGIIALGAFAVLIALSRSQARKKRMHMALRAREMFDRIVQRKSLTEEELSLLEKMGSCLPSPDQKHLLLERKSTFNSAVERLKQEEDPPSDLIAGLRLKLGFTTDSEQGIPYSTSDLPRRQAVYLKRTGSRRNIPGTLVHTDPDGLHIAVEPGSILPVPGVLVQVYFMNKTGLYSFVTVVRKIQGYMVQVGHSEEIKRVQRRKYYRKKVNLPVFVKPADAHERPVRTTFHDLGGGGASMNNPGNRFQVGDRLDLFFYFEGGKPLLKVQADVIRTSEEQSRLHLIFRTLSESSRDRIIGFVLQQKQAAPT